jgi:hypothetical protein
MILLLKDIKGCSVRATDGDIGKVADCYFEEDRWVVRYLMVDTGGWLGGRKVLISPMSFERVDPSSKVVHLNTDRARVKGSPSWEVARPISRRYETEYYGYFGYPYYWGGAGLWGVRATPAGITVPQPPPPASQPAPTAGSRTEPEGESHIRSVHNVTGYYIQATDGTIGHLEDFLTEPDSWRIDSVIIDTSNMPGGKPVTLSSERIRRIDSSKKMVFVNATKDEIKNSLEFQARAYTGRY